MTNAMTAGRVALLVGLAGVQAALAGERLVCGFNTEADTKIWQLKHATVALSPEHATEAGRCLKATFSGKESNWPAILLSDKATLGGWDKYTYMVLDVFNPAAKIVNLGLRIDDAKTDDSDYTSYYYRTFKAFPGRNTLKVELKQMVTARKVRRIRPGEVTSVNFHIPYRNLDKKIDTVLLLDNLRLVETPTVKLPKALRAFDFGPWGSVVWPGFQRASSAGNYSDQAGFGWKALRLRRDRDFKVPDNLARDCVELWGKAGTFSIKLAPGRYAVWVLAGEQAGRDVAKAGFTITAEGRKAAEQPARHAGFLDALDPLAFEYRKANKSLWDVFVKDNFRVATFQADCADGVLDLTFESQRVMYLCALAVWPVQEARCPKLLEQIRAARIRQFNERLREVKPTRRPAAPAPKADERARGFILSAVDYTRKFTPYHVPAAADRAERLSIAACPGEYEPAVFVLYPLADQRVAVAVSDLTGPAGTIPAARIRLERAIHRYIPASRDMDSYYVKAWHLAPLAGMDAERGVPQQLWATVHVPAAARGGTYKGTLTVSGRGGAAKLPFEVQVYPFRLERPEATYAHAYSVPTDPRQMDMDLECMVRHGFNSVTPGIPSARPTRVDGKLRIDFARDNLFMAKVKAAGMTGPVPLFAMSIQGGGGGTSYSHLGFERLFKYKITDPAYLDDLTALTRLILDNARKNDWPAVYMYPSTEISNDDRLGPEFNRKLIEAIRKAGKVQVISSVNRPRDKVSAKDLDAIMYNAGVEIDEAAVKAVHAAGCKLWFQNIGGTRFNEGLYLLRTGAVGRRQWVMNWHAGNPYSDMQYGTYVATLYSNAGSFLFPTKQRTLGSIGLERMREGVDDYRYFQTLRNLIAKAGKAPRAAGAAARARKAFDEMVASAPVALASRRRLIEEDGLVDSKSFRNQKRLDAYRRRVAGLIVELRRALAGGN